MYPLVSRRKVMSFLVIAILLAGISANDDIETLERFYGDAVTLMCGGTPASWTFQEDGQSEVDATEGSSSRTASGKFLYISNVSGSDEGLYTCKYGSNQQKQINLTVLGVGRFDNCSFQDNYNTCASKSPLSFIKGNDITITVPFTFYGGGNRNQNQSIKSINIFNSSTKIIRHTCNNNGDCTTMEVHDDDRIEYEFSDSKQYIASVSVKNATIEDSGVYMVKIELLYSNIHTIEWNVTVNVSYAIYSDPTTLSIIPSTSVQSSATTATIPRHMINNSKRTILMSSSFPATVSSISHGTASNTAHSSATNNANIVNMNPSSGSSTQSKGGDTVVTVTIVVVSLLSVIIVVIAAIIVTLVIKKRYQFARFMPSKTKIVAATEPFQTEKNLFPDKISVTNKSLCDGSVSSVPTENQIIYEQRVLHSDGYSLSHEHNSIEVTV